MEVVFCPLKGTMVSVPRNDRDQEIALPLNILPHLGRGILWQDLNLRVLPDPERDIMAGVTMAVAGIGGYCTTMIPRVQYRIVVTN